MKKTLFIAQPFGIGDILFAQKIIHHYAAANFRVVVPLIDTLSWLRYYLLPHPNVEYPVISRQRGQWSGDFKFAPLFISLYAESLHDGKNSKFREPLAYNGGSEEEQFIFIPLSSTYEQPGAKLMPSKYEFVGLDYADWVEHVHFRRRPHVERELYYEVLGLNDQSRFTLVNEESSRSRLPISVPGEIVKLRRIDGFTLFDWSLVVEKAAQIVTIDTSLVLLAEILKQQKPLYMISRYDPPSFDAIEDVLQLKWNLVPTPAELTVSAA